MDTESAEYMRWGSSFIYGYSVYIIIRVLSGSNGKAMSGNDGLDDASNTQLHGRVMFN